MGIQASNLIEAILAATGFCLTIVAVTVGFYILAGRKIAKANRSFGLVSTRWFASLFIVIGGLTWIYTGRNKNHLEMAVAFVFLTSLFAFPISKFATEKLFRR